MESVRTGFHHLRSPPGDSPQSTAFLSLINDLPTGITSKLRLFAISNPDDSVALQEDMNKLQKRSDIWQMKFNTEKCHTKRIILHCNTSNADCHLGGFTLSVVTQHPYLGVIISNTKSWQSHITTSPPRVLGLIRQNLRGTSQKLRQQANFLLVVEYWMC